MSNADYSEKIATLRSKLGISQEELASRLNVSFATVNRWENGKSQPQSNARKLLEQMIANSEGAEPSSTATNGTRKKRGTQKSQVLSTKSMEQMLWSAACSIRGEKDAPKFKDYILPLVFIKRLSDVFEDEVDRLAETYGDKETALHVLEADHSLVRFYIPPEARWPVVSGRDSFEWPKDKKPKTLGEQLTTTIRSIVKQNNSLSGVIDIVDFNETRNGEREISDSALRGIVETLSDPRYRLGLHDVEPDFLGRAYEYLLRKFAEGQGQSAGEFFTPREVGFIMARIMRPRPGEECYDYACGSAGLLVKLQLTLKDRDPLGKIPLKLFGQELTGSSYAIAQMNMIIHDMAGAIMRGNSMENPKFKDASGRLKRFDIVVANPMWNQPFDPAIYEKDGFGRFEEQGGTTASKGDWAWLQHTLGSLKENGRAAVILDTGAVTRGSGSKNEDKEKKIRKWFVDKDYVEGVILLPDNLFYNTTAAGIIIILNKSKPKNRKNKIILINASQVFEKGAPKNFIPEDGIQKIADAFVKGEAIENFVSVINAEQAIEKDYNLSPSTYVSSATNTVLEDPQKLLEKLSVLTIQQKAVDDSLKSIFEKLNYEF